MKQRAIKMPDELWAAIQRRAKAQDLTAGELVRRLVEQGIASEPQPPRANGSPVRTDAPFACPVCGRRFASQVRCGCSNRLAQ